MPISFRYPRFFLCLGTFLLFTHSIVAALPLTSKEILLMLRAGSTKEEISRDIVSRKVLEPLTPEFQKQLLAAGADASLVALYERSLLPDQKADEARADLAKRKNAEAASRSKTLDEIARIPDPIRSQRMAGSVSPFLQQIRGDLITTDAQKFTGSLTEKRYIALYFSASWCGPCKEFTPNFVKFYESLKAQRNDFEVIFVSRDRNAKDMMKYMTNDKMPWLALAYEASSGARQTVEKYAGNGIPNLVLLDTDGQVISQSYRNGQYVGPGEVLRDWQALYAAK